MHVQYGPHLLAYECLGLQVISSDSLDNQLALSHSHCAVRYSLHSLLSIISTTQQYSVILLRVETIKVEVIGWEYVQWRGVLRGRGPALDGVT